MSHQDLLKQQPKHLFERAPTLLATISPDGVLLELNARWEGAFGYARDELQGHFLVEFVDPTDQNRLKTHLQNIITTGDDSIALSMRSKYGTYHNLRWNMNWGDEDAVIYAHIEEIQQPRIDPNQATARFREQTGMSIDVLVKVLLDYDKILYTVLNPDGSIRFESNTAEQFFGCAPTTFVNQPLLQLIHPNDRLPWVQHLQGLLNGDMIAPGDLKYRRRNQRGDWVYLRTHSFAMFDQGELQNIILISANLTEHYQMVTAMEHMINDLESQLQAISGGRNNTHSTPNGLKSLASTIHKDLSEDLPMSLLVFDHRKDRDNFAFAWANHAATTWLNMTRDQMRALNVEDFGPSLKALGHDVLQQHSTLMCRLSHPDNVDEHLNALLFGIQNWGVGLVFEHHQTQPIETAPTEHNALSLIQEAQHHNQDHQEGYIFDWNHELRTPLNTILGYAEMLIEEAEDEHELWQKDLKKIQYSATYLNTMLNNFSSLRQLKDGNSNIVLDDVQIKTITKMLMRQVKTVLPSATTPYSPDENVEQLDIYTDQQKLLQALLNLLYFAQHYAKEPSQVQLIIKPKKDAVAFTWDVGQVHPLPGHLEGLLNQDPEPGVPFNVNGPLLGLAIAQEWTRIMGGQFVYDHSLDGTLKLTIAMPTHTRWPSVSDEYEALQAIHVLSDEITEANAVDTAVHTGHASVVLVIDDDPLAHEMIRRFVQKRDCHVASAFQGQRGLEIARRIQPTCILLDVVMYKTDGWTILTQLKAEPLLANTPIIIQSIIEDEELTASLGAAGHIQKPLERSKLLDVLDQQYHPDRCVVLSGLSEDSALPQRLSRHLSPYPAQHWLETSGASQTIELLRLHRPDVILWDTRITHTTLESLFSSLTHFEMANTIILIIQHHPLSQSVQRQMELFQVSCFSSQEEDLMRLENLWQDLLEQYNTLKD